MRLQVFLVQFLGIHFWSKDPKMLLKPLGATSYYFEAFWLVIGHFSLVFQKHTLDRKLISDIDPKNSKKRITPFVPIFEACRERIIKF